MSVATVRSHRLSAAVARLAVAACALCVMTGCAGYQVGNQTLYRPDIQTVYVPVFQSDTLRRGLGERLTEAVIKEIQLNTPYRVVHTPAADSVLTGRVLNHRKRVLVENLNDEPRDIEVAMEVQVTWFDRRGAVLSQAVIVESDDLIPEAGQSIVTAQQETIGRLAQDIVQQMEIGW